MSKHLPSNPPQMDRMERYKIEGSIKDVIAILDSAPIQRDMVPDVNFVQLTNRVPIAHLAIERGFKALITDTGARREKVHSLNALYRDLQRCNEEAARFLAGAFDDAVKFFGINVNASGRGHFRSLHDYLSKVGTDKAFDALRYWVIDHPDNRYNPIPYIFVPIHRELLCALACLFGPGRKETVSQRVEDSVWHSMFNGRDMSYTNIDTRKKRSVHAYQAWLINQNKSASSILKDAARTNFNGLNDEFIIQTLRAAHQELKESKDPAVRYFALRITYLTKGSQRRNRDAVPDVNWLNDAQTFGEVLTSAGTFLGFVEKYADGGWGIQPSESGLAQVADIAETFGDAKHYLVNRLTRQVEVIVNGETKLLRIVGERRSLFFSVSDAEWTADCDQIDFKKEYELEFWDNTHGLVSGDQIVIKLRRHEFPGVIDILEGKVHSIDGHRVSIEGWNYSDLDDER